MPLKYFLEAGIGILPSLSVSNSGSFSVYNRVYIFALPYLL